MWPLFWSPNHQHSHHNQRQCRQDWATHENTVAMSAMAMVESENIVNIQEVAVLPVVNTITEQTLINTIQVTLEKSACVISMNARYLHCLHNHRSSWSHKVWKSSVNLDKLWTLVPDEVREKFLGKTNETAPVIDTLALVTAQCGKEYRLIGTRDIQRF